MIPRSKIIGVGRNYAEHAAEMGNELPAAPLLFLEPNTSVIGKVTRNVSPERALEQVFGYTVANDVTARDAQRSDDQWARAKGFSSACPLGPWVVPGLDVDDLRIGAWVNGETRQDGSASQLIFDVAHLISYASEALTLLPGDVILTGTPAGVGPIVHGDVVEIEIEEIGVLRNPVIRRD